MKIGIVGAGLVGSGWTVVFARSATEVIVYDHSAEQRGQVLGRVRSSLEQMAEYGLVTEPGAILARIRVTDDLDAAVASVDYVQESVFEEIETKKTVATQIDRILPAGVLVGSSTSGFPSSAFTEDLKKRSQFLVVHPVNPPHLVPIVEIVPAAWTAPDAASRVRTMMEQIGQIPVVVNREIDGFILNRLQGALLDEAWRLFDAGYASAADIDRTVSDGLGLRWSFMGPFETIDLNAPGGIEDYARRLAPMYRRLAETQPDVQAWSDRAVDRATRELRAIRPAGDLLGRRNWRDERLMALVAHKARMKARS